MTIDSFKAYVKTGKPLDTEEIHQLMEKMSDEARRVTFRLNSAYHTAEEIRQEHHGWRERIHQCLLPLTGSWRSDHW